MHVPGAHNILADTASWKAYATDKEWQLDPRVFTQVTKELGGVDVDLFASRLNAQCTKVVSWQPDPMAFAIDAFMLDWTQFNAYAFPPFSVIPSVLQHLTEQGAELLLIAPLWKTQHWFPRLLQMVTDFPRILPPNKDLLRLPQAQGKTHPF